MFYLFVEIAMGQFAWSAPDKNPIEEPIKENYILNHFEFKIKT